MKFELPFLKYLKRSSSRNHRGHVHTFVHPVREWWVSLIVTIVVAAALFAHAGLEFYRQYSNSDVPVVSEEHIPRYKEVDAELLIRYHEGRAAVFNDLRKNTLSVPSVQTPIGTPASTKGADVDMGTETVTETPQME